MQVGKRYTHNRPHKTPLPILLQPPQRILLIPRALDDSARPYPLRGRVLEDGAQLVRRRQLLGHVELELAARLVLGVVRVVGGLVLGGGLGGGCAGGAEDIEDAGGRGQGGFVEEGDYVEGFGLVVRYYWRLAWWLLRRD